MFTTIAIVPIIKNKTGDTNDKNNYRPIVLVKFLNYVSNILEDYLVNLVLKENIQQIYVYLLLRV